MALGDSGRRGAGAAAVFNCLEQEKGWQPFPSPPARLGSDGPALGSCHISCNYVCPLLRLSGDPMQEAHVPGTGCALATQTRGHLRTGKGRLQHLGEQKEATRNG